ncbi:hypothetical protein NE237_026333 [Protea cynaroides]|uniref:Integrase catalytic domain-containing protein n=1 Tax=Protea cynaroides TaxID=273540 RepID=A0A9Q0K1D4_9MAGN|nr:hypothetical protein NE237_026333 [Protea cynaroides]
MVQPKDSRTFTDSTLESQNVIKCQICKKPGHTALKCWCRLQTANVTLPMNEILTKKVLASENRQGGLYALLDTAQGQRCSATGSGESFGHNDGGDGGAQSFLVSKGAKSDILHTGNVENNYFCTFNSPMDSSNSVVNNSNVLDSSNVDMNNSNSVVDNSENALVADDNDTVVEALFSTRFKSVSVDTWHKRLGHPQNLFARLIKVFQCDGGGEFSSLKFRNHLTDSGVLLNISYPATPKENSIVERKHRPMVELGLAMMFNASVPTQFWVEAFSTVVFLINRLPSTVLNLDSPLHVLTDMYPDYSMLWVFGCQCFPYLRPCMKNKLEPRSLACVFFGYSDLHKGPIEKSTVEKGPIENSSPAQLIGLVLNPGSVLSTGPDQFPSTVETTDPVPSAGPSSSGQPLDSTLAEFAGGC